MENKEVDIFTKEGWWERMAHDRSFARSQAQDDEIKVPMVTLYMRADPLTGEPRVPFGIHVLSNAMPSNAQEEWLILARTFAIAGDAFAMTAMFEGWGTNSWEESEAPPSERPERYEVVLVLGAHHMFGGNAFTLHVVGKEKTGKRILGEHWNSLEGEAFKKSVIHPKSAMGKYFSIIPHPAACQRPDFKHHQEQARTLIARMGITDDAIIN